MYYKSGIPIVFWLIYKIKTFIQPEPVFSNICKLWWFVVNAFDDLNSINANYFNDYYAL